MERAEKTIDDADVRVQAGGSSRKRLKAKRGSRNTEKNSGK